MAPLTPEQQTRYEAQAARCLEVAAAHKSHLLDVATKVMGAPERGWDLYADTLLNCHDAIQSGGFEGDGREVNYLNYLRFAIHHNGKAERGRSSRYQPLPHRLGQAADDDAGTCAESRAHLATQISIAVREKFPARDGQALELHLKGYTLHQISEMTEGGHYSRIHRRLTRMKQQLSESFGPIWNTLF